MTHAADGPTRTIARQMRDLRNARGWSAEQLAGALNQYGVKWDRSIVANLENGRRQSVSVEEWLALALALDVSPLRLLLPAKRTDSAGLTPTYAVAWQVAWRWAVGEGPIGEDLRLDDPKVSAWIGENRPFELSPITEAARLLGARMPAPWSATIRKTSSTEAAKGQLISGDFDEGEEEVDDGEHQEAT